MLPGAVLLCHRFLNPVFGFKNRQRGAVREGRDFAPGYPGQLAGDLSGFIMALVP